MNRVAVISQLPPPFHGSTLMTNVFVETLDELKVEWRLVERRFSSRVDEVGRFSFRKLLSALWMPARLIRTMLMFRPSVTVFFVTNRPLSFLVDWLLSEILRVSGQRRVLYIHTVGFVALAQRGSVWRLLVRRLLSSGDDVVCLGPTLAADVTPWVPAERIVFISNSVPSRPSFDEIKASSGRPLILYLSNLIKEKGAEDFVDMALAMAASFPEADFLIAGASASKEFTAHLHERARNSPCSHQVRFIGLVSDQDEKWRLLKTASVLVFPSTYPYEAQPLTILESMSVGTPVVAYDVGGLKDIVESSRTGYLLRPGDIASLTSTVSDLLRDQQARRQLGANAAAVYEKKHSRGAYAERWRRLLNDDLKGQP